MQIYTDLLTTHDNNAHVISVTIDSNEENTDIWNNCISSEFPIINMNMDKGQAICLIGSPHQGYTLNTSQKNGRLHGEAFLYDYDNRVVASLTYQEGVANGKCTIYYRSGEIYFSGILYKGYRHGPGVEYNKDGSPIYEGFFKNGRRAPNIKLRSDGSNYWDEKDEKDEMVSLFQIDVNGLNHGICYFYCDGEISKISRWEHGYETESLKKFNGPIMKVFKNGQEVYYGRFRKESDFEYDPIYLTENQTESDLEESIEEEWGGKCECTFSCFKYYYVVIMITIGLISGTLYIIYQVLLHNYSKDIKLTISCLYTIFLYSIMVFCILFILLCMYEILYKLCKLCRC